MGTLLRHIVVFLALMVTWVFLANLFRSML